MTAPIAVIGGTGLYRFLDGATQTRTVETPYGATSAPITLGEVAGRQVAFLPRHGLHHEFSPHTVPYRANLWALHSLGVRKVLAPCAVGSLDSALGPGTIVVPDQLVDRTTSRTSTYFDGGGVHVSFADPYCPTLRAAAAPRADRDGATMVVIEGPRFSTRAESRWYAAQGWELVNMTGLPEAALARELKLCYASIALVTDLDAGIEAGEGVHADDVLQQFAANLPRLTEVLTETIAAISPGDECTCAAGDHDLSSLQ
ncbi:S-methyl-5'-thioadenosine phosphorylase [Nocardiopsis tropica]|uniref:S-methyl-5'-thioadenosine phosphorylase n=1 Tax=Tsukamurella strandjordii TaxID=147577 RepID=UPI0031D5CF57